MWLSCRVHWMRHDAGFVRCLFERIAVRTGADEAKVIPCTVRPRWLCILWRMCRLHAHTVILFGLGPGASVVSCSSKCL